jgi:transcriptional regulator with XRE-family HTH domain
MLHDFIQHQRTQRGFSQQHLADLLGISRQTYMLIEKGEREITVKEAKALAAEFEIPFFSFLSEEESGAEIIYEKEFREKAEPLQIRVQHKDWKKFKQVLLYVLTKVGGKPNVGETVLHKLLYFIDFDYYEKFEENLMGSTYIKNQHGPTSVELGSLMKEMQEQGEVEAVSSKYFKYKQKKYIAVKKPNLALLSARETSHIDGVLARLSDKNAKEIEAYSHGDIPWRSAKDGKPISYESVFYRDEPYSVRNYDDAV